MGAPKWIAVLKGCVRSVEGRSKALADALRAAGLFCDDVCEQSKTEDDTWEMLKWLVSSEESPVSQKRVL